MIFRFLILSDEVDDFKREIKIDSEATFLDLYNIIMDSVGYTKDQMCSFFICDEDWSKKTEITLVEMDTSSEVDNYIMKDTVLDQLLEDEHQKLLFVFDYLTERAFFMYIVTIILVAVFTALGISSANAVESIWGKDPARVVIDEMVGVWIPLIIVPGRNIWFIVGAFALFRLFDIFKPLGIRKMENFKGGIGVMYLISAIGNRYLKPKDYLSLSFGLKMQIL